MIVLKNIQWENKDLPDTYEIKATDDIELCEYLQGDLENTDGIRNFVADQMGSPIRSADLYAEVAVSFTCGLYSYLYGDTNEIINKMEENDLYNCMDDYDYVLVEVPFQDLVDYYHEMVERPKEVRGEDETFGTWFTEEYTTDHTNGLLDFMQERGHETNAIFVDKEAAMKMYNDFCSDIEAEMKIIYEER